MRGEYWPMRGEFWEYWPIRGEYWPLRGEYWPMRGEYYLRMRCVWPAVAPVVVTGVAEAGVVGRVLRVPGHDNISWVLDKIEGWCCLHGCCRGVGGVVVAEVLLGAFAVPAGVVGVPLAPPGLLPPPLRRGHGGWHHEGEHQAEVSGECVTQEGTYMSYTDLINIIEGIP